MKRGGLIVLSFLAAALFASCVFRGSAGVTVPPPPVATVHVGAQIGPPPPVVIGPPPPAVIHATVRPTFAANVQVLGSSCNPGAPEVLNGVDDNCNGQIDEGWVQSGDLQITLGWSTAADLDLYVIDPQGFEISYQQAGSPTGARLDRDARGSCTDGETGENIYWSGGPPPGHYIVRVNYYSTCDMAGPTTFVVSVAYNGEIVGAYQYTVGDQQTVDVVEFDL